MRCEICGSETDRGVNIEMEGTELFVCTECEDLGSTVTEKEEKKEKERTKNKTEAQKTKSSNTKSNRNKHKKDKIEEPFEELATNYGNRIKDARESKDMTQEELSEELGVKESRIKKIEREEMTPDESLRKSLESFLDISLTEEIKSEEWESKGVSGEYTIGDVIERK